MKKLSQMMILFLSLSVCLMIPALADSAEVKMGGTITVAFDEAPKGGMDPHISTDTSASSHYELVYESLVMFSDKLEVLPCLAESWTQPDPKTIVFNLRKGVKFHNGREMTADDVKYSIDRMRNPKVSTRPQYWDAIKSVDILDKYKVKVNLHQIDVNLMEMLANNRVSAIVPREVIEKSGDLKTTYCGTGPFMIKEHNPGVHTIYVKNKDYWMKGYPRVDTIMMPIMADESSRLAALRKGTIDIGWFLGPQMANAAKAAGLTVFVPTSTRQMKLYLHHKTFPGNIKKLRQAISCAIDRKAMIKTIMLGFGEVTSCIPPASTPYSLSQEEIMKLPYHTRDLKLAKKLMAEAGYPNGFELEIATCTRSEDWTPAMEMVQAQLREAGINAKLVQRDWGTHFNMWQKGTFNGGLVMGASTWYTVDNYIATYFYSKAKSNVLGVNNPKLDALLDESGQTLDMKKRIELWKQIQYEFAEDVDCIFPYAGPVKYEVVSNRIKDYKFSNNASRLYLRDAWIDK